MDLGSFNLRDQMTEIYVFRLPKNKYCLEGVEEESLSPRQLWQVLRQYMGVDAEEVAFMLLAFKENPQAMRAAFGFNGEFLFCK